MGNVFAADYRTTAMDVVRRYNPNLTGKTVLVTGCTSGMGVETARALASTGCTLYISGRNPTSLNSTRDQLNAELRQDGRQNQVHSLVCDLSDLQSVRKAGADFLARSSALHLLVLNAGLMGPKYRLTAQGLDLQMGVNHVGHFLLFRLLQQTLLASAPSRVVAVSSNAFHMFGPPRIDYARLPSVPSAKYNPNGAYSQSKLANVLFVMEVHRRFASQGLTAYALHPGLFLSGLQEDMGGPVFNTIAWLTSPLWKSVQQGAATSVYCAVAPELESHSGQYFVNCHAEDRLAKTKFADDEAINMWDWTEKFIAQHTTQQQQQQ